VNNFKEVFEIVLIRSLNRLELKSSKNMKTQWGGVRLSAPLAATSLSLRISSGRVIKIWANQLA